MGHCKASHISQVEMEQVNPKTAARSHFCCAPTAQRRLVGFLNRFVLVPALLGFVKLQQGDLKLCHNNSILCIYLSVLSRELVTRQPLATVEYKVSAEQVAQMRTRCWL